jgi:hypothetical protein
MKKRPPLEEFKINVLGVMTFTEDTQTLLDAHPKKVWIFSVKHNLGFPQGTGYSQFLRNYSVVMLQSYFEDYVEKQGLGYPRIESSVESGQWGLLNEFRNARNCIIHNRCMVDEKYMRNVRGTNRKIGEPIIPDIDYLRTNADNLKVVASRLDDLHSVNAGESDQE